MYEVGIWCEEKKIASNSANYKVRVKYVSVLHVPRKKNKKDGWMGETERKEVKEKKE